jgi:hypothetical protein
MTKIWDDYLQRREPYVGRGRDGCLRSAQIDREEADCHDPGEYRDALLASAERWEELAASCTSRPIVDGIRP